MISVVIPSLGGDCLQHTISSLNSGSVKPDEILVCLPSASSINQVNINYDNTRLINVGEYGQVAQRIFGFKESQYEYVLQLDDDIILDNKCIEKLMISIGKNNKLAVSPYYMDHQHNSIHMAKSYGVLRKIYYWLMNGKEGYESGAIAKSGINFGINTNDLNDQKVVEVEWQPGGCVLHRNDNLVFNNYYPFSGKAYSEDLIHSFLLRSKGISLLTCLESFCYIQRDNGIDNLLHDFKARYHFVKIASLSKTRMFIFYFLFVMNMSIKKIIKIIRRSY